MVGREELLPAAQLGLPSQNYSFHPGCPCHRPGPALAALLARQAEHAEFWAGRLGGPVRVPAGVFIGLSSCNQYTSVLGAGQRVLSYSYYSPWRTVRKQ